MPTVDRQSWGNAPDGPVDRYRLTNDSGNSVSVLTYGGIVQSIRIAGVEVVLGFDRLEGYLGENPAYGALIGRYANRIAGASFPLHGQTVRLVPNENGNQLHGGPEGFNKQRWEAKENKTEDLAGVTLSRLSPDGEMGFPGNLRVNCVYEWDNRDRLTIRYTATTDRDTVINLTNHSYFNLAGQGQVLDHVLTVHADRYTPIAKDGIPLGELSAVSGTPFDFRTAKAIGRDIDSDDPQLRQTNGYDHNYAVRDYDSSLREVAVVSDPASGRTLRCLTTEPGIQVFTTNFPTGKFIMRGGTPTPLHGGICLETQHFPDAPNQQNFATPLLKAGETYNTTTVYRFE